MPTESDTHNPKIYNPIEHILEQFCQILMFVIFVVVVVVDLIEELINKNSLSPHIGIILLSIHLFI